MNGTSPLSPSTTRKTETTTAAPAVITNSYLQSLDDFSNGGIKGGVPEFTDKFTAISYEQADRNSDITDIVTIDVQTDDEVKYYVKPNETFIIEVLHKMSYIEIIHEYIQTP